MLVAGAALGRAMAGLSVGLGLVPYPASLAVVLKSRVEVLTEVLLLSTTENVSVIRKHVSHLLFVAAMCLLVRSVHVIVTTRIK